MRLSRQAMAKPPPGEHSHANLPIKPLQHAQRGRGAKVARSRRMTSLHDPRAHEQGDEDANSLVVEQARSPPHTAQFVRPCRWQCRVTDE